MNDIRVDRLNSRTIPVGMNSILYIGDSVKRATRVFDDADPGKDDWGQPNPAYGVAISRWDYTTRSYVIIKEKGLP